MAIGDNDNLEQTRKQVAVAEQKVAAGIKKLYDEYVSKLADGVFGEAYKNPFDEQGIATVVVSAEKAEALAGADFPNGLKNGIILHVFKEGYAQHPPVAYLAQQKIQSLCDAAKQDFPVCADAAQRVLDTLNQKLKAKVKSIYTEAQQEAERKEKNRDPNLKSRDNVELKDFNAVQQKRIEKNKLKLITEKTKAFVEEQSAEALGQLYVVYKNALGANHSLSEQEFSKQVLETSSHHRSNNQDILTFNQSTKRFSYDEAAKVTAHNREVGKGCANLSLTFEGNYQDAGVFAVTSSLVKHASLVAINSLKNSDESREDILVDTYKNAKQVIEAMVRLRQHGRSADEQKQPMTIDWTYQLLTTNAWNSEKQATTYGYIVKAMHLLNQGTLEVDGINVTVNASVMNAGINRMGAWNLLLKKDTQRIENRRAYLQMGDALAETNKQFSLRAVPGLPEDYKFKIILETLASPSAGINNKESIKRQSLLDREENQRARYANALAESKALAIYFPNLVQAYDQARQALVASPEDVELQAKARQAKEDIKAHAKASKDVSGQLRSISYQIEKIHRERWKLDKAAKFNAIRDLKAHPSMEKLNANLASVDATVKSQATDAVLKIAAMTYKTFMDDLYYSGEYREPKKAAIFNAYCAAYQRLTGMMASAGCKSANDRTYIARLFLASLEGNRAVDAVKMPENCHDDAEAYKKLLKTMSDNAMSHGAMYSCINDTGGGTPKVSTSWKAFSYLSGMFNIDSLKKFGKFAAHKMADAISSMFSSFGRKLRSAISRVIAGLADAPALAARAEVNISYNVDAGGFIYEKASLAPPPLAAAPLSPVVAVAVPVTQPGVVPPPSPVASFNSAGDSKLTGTLSDAQLTEAVSVGSMSAEIAMARYFDDAANLGDSVERLSVSAAPQQMGEMKGSAASIDENNLGEATTSVHRGTISRASITKAPQALFHPKTANLGQPQEDHYSQLPGAVNHDNDDDKRDGDGVSPPSPH